MPEFFITARSFAAPFVSDESEKYVEADTPSQALTDYAADYSHPCGLYAAEAWTSADAYHKKAEPLARWLSNHAFAMQEATKGLKGYSVSGHGPGDFEINGTRHRIDNPTGGSVMT